MFSCTFHRRSRVWHLLFFLSLNHAKILLMKFSKVFLLVIFGALMFARADAQPATRAKIFEAIEQRNYALALSELKNFKEADSKTFETNNYDYLAARMAEKSGDLAAAMAYFHATAARDSILKEYALWHSSRLARTSGSLMLERIYLQELIASFSDSLLNNGARNRLPRSYFESKNYSSAIALLNAPLINGVLAKDSSADAKPEKIVPSLPALSTAAARENALLLAQAFLQTGETARAREIFAKLIAESPNPGQPDDYALEAARALDRTEIGAENFGKRVAPLSDYEHLRRASIYTFNRDYAAARLHYRAIIENHPTSGIVPDAIYQIGRAFAQSGENIEAINWFERAQQQFPEHPIAKDALAQTASMYARLNKPREAVARYQKHIEKYPNAENPERAFLNIIDTLRDAGETTDALKWTAKTQETFRGKLPEALALFAQARIRIAQSDWQNALADLEKLQTFADLGGTRVPGGTNQAEITFLKGFALEQMRKYAEAIEVYLSIPDGRNEYYGWRATERLKTLASEENARPLIVGKIGEFSANIEEKTAETQKKSAQSVLRLTDSPEIRAKMLDVLRKVYAVLPDYQKVPNFKLLELGRRETLKEKRAFSAENYHQNLADELLFLGLYDEAAPELEKAQTENRRAETSKPKINEAPESAQNPKTKTQNPKSADFAYTLAVFYQRGEMAHRAVGFAEPLWRSVPADYQIELMPRQQIELLYPAPYAASLVKFAAERQVDPRFALSIMRQESRFRADVKSYAAARGLMQFISTTADRIAGELGRENFQQDELYHPPTAILFGSQYLADLFKQFPNQPAAVAASYNGGETNVARWMARSKTEMPDRYVPEIVFSQSKDYVYKVLANERVYRFFYDENLKLR